MIASTIRSPSPSSPPLRIQEHFAALTTDMADRGVPITRLNLISYATDLGLPEPVVIAVAALIEDAQ